MLSKPLPAEYPPYYKIYIDLAPDSKILEFLVKQTKELVNIYKGLTKEKLLFRYENDKWSLKQILGHLIDFEIIFGYRALTYARKDKSDLPMYDHNNYVSSGLFDNIESSLLINQYESIRNTNLLLFKTLTEDAWLEEGVTGGKKFSTRTTPYISAGHTQHHLKVIKEKYL